MQYIHIKNIEDYHSGYKDRTLIWAKVYFKLITNPKYAHIPEVDKYRLIAFICLELQFQEPVPINEVYLTGIGFDLQKRPISLTLQMLQNFVEPVTESQKPLLHRVEESRVDKTNVTDPVSPIKAVLKSVPPNFDPIWESYPRKIGKKDAERHFRASVKKGFTVEQIQKAVDNYKSYLKETKTEDKYIQHGSKFFNNWEDYLNYESSSKPRSRTDSQPTIRSVKDFDTAS